MRFFCYIENNKDRKKKIYTKSSKKKLRLYIYTIMKLKCIIVIIFLSIIFILLLTQKPLSQYKIEGGKKRKHYYENVWDDRCLSRNSDLDDILISYENKQIGKKIRQFLNWYKASYTSRQIYEHLIKEGYDEYDVCLQVGGEYISITGKETDKCELVAPHIIFIHKDHSCIRLKPIVGGKIYSYTPYPTMSFSIVYNIKDSSFYNEAFKITRDGEAIPKAGTNWPDACLNPDLSDSRINALMRSTHIRLPPPSQDDSRFFRKIPLTE